MKSIEKNAQFKDDEEKPLVSVICLCFNEELYIKQALESILDQKTNFTFEIICHDDASTDGTSNIIQEYAEKYPDKIVPILQEDNKVSKGEQIILKYIYPVSRGKYMAYCDGDDYWTDKNKLQKQVDFLENHLEYSLCVHNFKFYYENTNKIINSKCSKIDKDISTRSYILWRKDIPQIGTGLWRKEIAYHRPELFYKIGGNEESLRWISDYPLCIYLSLNGRVKYLKDNMSVWRRRTYGTWSKDASDIARKLNYNKELVDFCKSLDKFTEKRYHRTICKYINTIYFDTEFIQENYKRAIKFFLIHLSVRNVSYLFALQ